MRITEYQEKVSKTAIYPSIGFNRVYPTLGLIGETGEFVERVKKYYRDKAESCDSHDPNIDEIAIGWYSFLPDEEKRKIVAELGDVLWYLFTVANESGIDVFDGIFELFSYYNNDESFGEHNPEIVVSFSEVDKQTLFIHDNLEYMDLSLSSLAFELSNNVFEISKISDRVTTIENNGGAKKPLMMDIHLLRTYLSSTVVLVSLIAMLLGSSSEEVAEYNIEKLNSRKDNNMLHGDGSDRERDTNKQGLSQGINLVKKEAE
ncbi:hypothetical protein M0R04_05875 [Candidatus Dojkabacteria bacterium]|jgi:NTP pyrophosphatase (non-canonical NTP hydrolase)|nr:hypothetical protein [Candidatus Dojkabacteria bacterium]